MGAKETTDTFFKPFHPLSQAIHTRTNIFNNQITFPQLRDVTNISNEAGFKKTLKRADIYLFAFF